MSGVTIKYDVVDWRNKYDTFGDGSLWKTCRNFAGPEC